MFAGLKNGDISDIFHDLYHHQKNSASKPQRWRFRDFEYHPVIKGGNGKSPLFFDDLQGFSHENIQFIESFQLAMFDYRRVNHASG
jgi:hypothetical protein